jgi:filamentous hemagglutinin family protein
MQQTLVFLALPIATIASISVIATTANAQITPDTSLGAESSTVTSNQVIRDIQSDRIDGGAIRGANLFHSFQEFNVAPDRGAYFSNPAGISNILTRVTGANPSNILGRLGVLGNANLFFINPNGIFFGSNARLDVGGSFFASTANSLIFDNGFEFDAKNPQAPPLLTVNIPTGLRFRDNPGTLTNQSSALQVTEGKSLSLVGGDVRLDGGRLFAAGGRVELGGLTAAGTVELNDDGSLSFPVGVQRGDVSLTNGAIVSVSSGGGGNIAVNARNLEIVGGSLLGAGIDPGLGTPGAQAGDIRIDATEKVRIEGTTNSYSGILNSTGNFSLNSSNIREPGNAGNVVINTGTLEGNGNILISSSTNGEGNAGKVIITAKDKVSLISEPANSFAFVASFVGTSGIGNGADLIINTPSLSLSNAALITSTAGQGNAGNIQLNASESISVGDRSQLQAATFGRGNAGNIIIEAENAAVSFDGANTLVSTSVGRSSTGKGGDLTIKARNLSVTNGALLLTTTSGQANAGSIEVNTNNLSLTNGAQISASTFGKGNAGSVSINATGNISADGEDNSGGNSGIFATVEEQAEGDAGGVKVNTNDLSLTNGAQINANTLGKGNAGSVIVNATGTIFASGEGKDGFNSGIFSNVETSDIGNAGGIEINTNNLTLSNGAVVSASTFGQGNAGSIVINSTGDISIDGEDKDGFNSGIFSTVNSSGVGNAGGVTVSTNDLSLTNGAQINASTFGKGNAGSVSINATGNISADGEDNSGGNSGIFATVEEQAEGDAGGVKVNTNDLSLTNGAQINANTLGKGNAGSVIVNATGTIFASGEGKDGFNSGIFSNVETSDIGNAGGIEINTNNLTLSNGAVVSASTFGQGNAGSIVINSTGDISIDGEAKNGFNSGVFSQVAREQAEGNAGGIKIDTNNISLTGGAVISTSTFGKGNAGSVIINAAGSISADGADTEGFNSGIYSGVDSSAVGNAGGINITARSLSLTNSARLSTSNSGNGAAGDIKVTTAKDIRLDNQASISANTSGGQGNIILNSRDLILRRNSNITTNATGTATGGNIAIDTGSLVGLENSTISANAEQGFGGNVTVNAQGIFLSPDSEITASSELGPQFSGTVQLNTPEAEPNRGLVELPENFVDPTQQIAQNPCQRGTESKFIISGRGGLPSNPNQNISSDNVRVDLIAPAITTTNAASMTVKSTPTTATINKIVPARGWILNNRGEVVLTAYDPTNIGEQRRSRAIASCAAP